MLVLILKDYHETYGRSFVLAGHCYHPLKIQFVLCLITLTILRPRILSFVPSDNGCCTRHPSFIFGLYEEKFIEFGIDKFDLETLLDDLFGDFQ